MASVAALARAANGHTAEMVAIARRAGASWSQIGEALGISKQAAHKHFRTPPPPALPVAPAAVTPNPPSAPVRSRLTGRRAGPRGQTH